MPGWPCLQHQAVPGSRDSPCVPGTGMTITVLGAGGEGISPVRTQDITSSQGEHSFHGEEEQSSHSPAQVTLNTHTPGGDPSLFSTLGLVWHHANTMNAFITLMLHFTGKREKASGQKPASQGCHNSLNLQKENPRRNSCLLLCSALLS